MYHDLVFSTCHRVNVGGTVSHVFLPRKGQQQILTFFSGKLTEVILFCHWVMRPCMLYMWDSWLSQDSLNHWMVLRSRRLRSQRKRREVLFCQTTPLNKRLELDVGRLFVHGGHHNVRSAPQCSGWLLCILRLVHATQEPSHTLPGESHFMVVFWWKP